MKYFCLLLSEIFVGKYSAKVLKIFYKEVEKLIVSFDNSSHKEKEKT
jgi:hypothetical protein